MPKPWETVSKTHSGDFKIFDIHRVRRVHPELSHQSEFVVISSAQWVNIIPVTNEGDVVLIRQYRHGVDEVTLEIPGGLVEPGEDEAVAAMRECVEETGFKAPHHAELLGAMQPNPAFLNNQCYSYLWRGCTRVAEQSLDRNEDIDVVLVPLAHIPLLIERGEIKHSLVLSAFMFYSLRNSF